MWLGGLALARTGAGRLRLRPTPPLHPAPPLPTPPPSRLGGHVSHPPPRQGLGQGQGAVRKWAHRRERELRDPPVGRLPRRQGGHLQHERVLGSGLTRRQGRGHRGAGLQHVRRHADLERRLHGCPGCVVGGGGARRGDDR